MKHRFSMPRAGLALALALLTASAARADSVHVGDTTGDKGRNADAVRFNTWSGTAPKDTGQADVNQPVKAKLWTAEEIEAAKKQLRDFATGLPDNEDRKRVRDTIKHNPDTVTKAGDLGPDLPPSWFVEWLKLQSDVTAQFIKPPPNKIRIVDQDALAKMTPAERKKIPVKYKKTKVCEKIVTYKPIYKTIEVAYPG